VTARNATADDPLWGALPRPWIWILSLLALSAFLTQVKLLPGLRNNLGPFEVLGALLIGVVFLAQGRSVPWHPLTCAALGLLAIGALSQVNIEYAGAEAGLVYTAILAFFALLLASWDALVVRYRIHPVAIMRIVVWSALAVSPWIVSQTITDPYLLTEEVGPFRNRAHMGNYMLTVFWLAFAYAQVPRLPRLERLAGYLGAGVSLYAIAVSGRRSVYLSLFLGLFALAASFVVARSRRGRVLMGIALALGLLFAMYRVGSRWVPKLGFFQARVGQIDDRLREALAPDDEMMVQQSFASTQLEGVKAGFSAHPLLGTGWGGFFRSQYSLDRHEIHSTPLRFLTETGLVGLALYVLFMALLFRVAGRSFVVLRTGPWGPVALTFLVALSSMSISYLYNRHITERTFWLFVIVLSAMDRAVERDRRSQISAVAARAAASRGRLAPSVHGGSVPG